MKPERRVSEDVPLSQGDPEPGGIRPEREEAETGVEQQMFRATFEYEEVVNASLEELNALGAEAWELIAVIGDRLILRRVNGMQQWVVETEVIEGQEKLDPS